MAISILEVSVLVAKSGPFRHPANMLQKEQFRHLLVRDTCSVTSAAKKAPRALGDRPVHGYAYTPGYPGRLAPGTRPSTSRQAGFN
jgi:hypothetical protein